MNRLLIVFLKWSLALFLSFGVAQSLLSKITVVPSTTVTNKDIEIFLLTNGVHTDLILPAQNEIINWDTVFPFDQTKAQDRNIQYIGIGWGDKESYIEPKEWIHMTPTVAFNAAMGLGTAALHITFHKDMEINQNCRSIMIAPSQYLQLIDYIHQYTQYNENKQAISITTNKLYGDYDAFYESNNRYSILFTCNSWINAALKKADLKACKWTVFAQPIFDKYPISK